MRGALGLVGLTQGVPASIPRLGSDSGGVGVEQFRIDAELGGAVHSVRHSAAAIRSLA